MRFVFFAALLFFTTTLAMPRVWATAWDDYRALKQKNSAQNKKLLKEFKEGKITAKKLEREWSNMNEKAAAAAKKVQEEWADEKSKKEGDKNKPAKKKADKPPDRQADVKPTEKTEKKPDADPKPKDADSKGVDPKKAGGEDKVGTTDGSGKKADGSGGTKTDPANVTPPSRFPIGTPQNPDPTILVAPPAAL